jgi:hypothetical protein
MANTFSYTALTNPYTQQAPSFESSLRNLARSPPRVPTPAAVGSLQSQLAASAASSSGSETIDWTFDLAQTLAKYVLLLLSSTTPRDEIPAGILAVFYLLTSAMEQWEDHVLYAVLVQDNNNDSKKNAQLLPALENWSCRDHPIHSTALVGLAASWRALDRLQTLTVLDPNKPDTPWWIPDHQPSSDLARVTSVAVNCLCRSSESAGFHNTTTSSSSSSYPYPGIDQVNLASSSILCSLLKHEITDWYYNLSANQSSALCQRLLDELHRLNSPTFPSASSSSPHSLSFALSSVCLLSLMQWRRVSLELADLDRTLHTTSLVEHVIHFSFPVATCGQNLMHSHNGPRWSYDHHYQQLVGHIGRDLVYCWSLAGGEAWSIVGSTERHWRPFLETFWNDILEGASQTSTVAKIPGVVVWHVVSRLTARGILFSALHSVMISDKDDFVEPCRCILATLLQLCRHVSWKQIVVIHNMICACSSASLTDSD